MKRKLIYSLALLLILFVSGTGLAMLYTYRITTDLEGVINLHRIELIRQNLVINAQTVQSNLYTVGTAFGKELDIIVENVTALDSSVHSCGGCHHSPEMTARLDEISSIVEQYKEAISYLITTTANEERVGRLKMVAVGIGDSLLSKTQEMAFIADKSLNAKTIAALKGINNSRVILVVTLIAAFCIALAIAGTLTRQITKPVYELVHAARMIASGQRDFRTSYRDRTEFGELAASFNEMANSLSEHVRKIEESERRYRLLFESAGDAIFILEAEGANVGRIAAANQAAADMHGYTVEELLDLNIKDLDTPDAAIEAPGRVQRMLQGERLNFEITHRKKDGTVFPVEVSGGLFEFANHRYILAFDRDITERKKMQEEILLAKQDWENTFNTIPDMITIHDKQFNIIRANREAETILGLPALNVLETVRCYEYYHGTSCPPERCPSCVCLRTGEPGAFETFEPHLDKYLEIRAMPRLSNGEVTGLVHIIRDITERKRTEEMLQRTEQLKMVGELAAGLAHEIKNPLTAIKMSIEVLSEEPTLSGDDRDVLLKVIVEIKRIESLIRGLLNFARPPKLQLTLVKVNEILDASLSLALKKTSSAMETVAVMKELDEDIPETMADPMQLKQVFLNLLLNASDAMPGGGTVRARTSYDSEKRLIVIEISDTGKGMDEKTIGKLFQPFFTTKAKGTGLGLAITKRLVEEQGGFISVESSPGAGTTFRIALPVKQETHEA